MRLFTRKRLLLVVGGVVSVIVVMALSGHYFVSTCYVCQVCLSKKTVSQWRLGSLSDALRLNQEYKEAEENLHTAKAADAQLFPAARR